jgi:tetratricopeptide (TPR) repeat protein
MDQPVPESRDSDWSRIEELFHAALELPVHERERWVDHETVGEPAIRNEVKSLLSAQNKHEELSRTESACTHPRDLGERLLGEFCGPYRLDRLIIQGGMAWVYEGARVSGDFSQRVAVKVLPATFGEALSERFRQEKQILAEMSHPGVARLLDGGVNQNGLSYLAMEYVEGEPISAYACHHQLSRRERIRLFLQVCEAVEFAHRQRVIHRDIKPGNILVTPAGQPKLLDFGIARLLDRENAGQMTLWRAYTPGYASPEQLRGEAGGAATDIYQLGVLLAELLTGEPPPKDESSGSPQEVDVRLRKNLGIDLAAIIAKARREHAADRYRSVALLAEDLNRYLDGRPVEAHRGAWIARTVKFARWYRVRITAAVLLFLLPIAGGAFLRQARLRRAERLRRATELYQSIGQGGPSIWWYIAANRPDLASQAWRHISDSVEQVWREDPDPKVAEVLANCYLGLGELAWLRSAPSLMDADAALQDYQRALELFDKAAKARPADIGVFHASANAHTFASDVRIEKGRGFEGFAELANLLLAAEGRRKTDVRARTMAFTGDLASYYDMLSDRLGANMRWPVEEKEWVGLAGLRPYSASDAIARTLYQAALASPDPDNTPSGTGMIRMQLGRLQHQAGLRAEGVRTLRQSLDELEALGWGQQVAFRIARVHSELGEAAQVEGDLAGSVRERQVGIKILEEQLNVSQQNQYLKEKLGEARISLAQVLVRLGKNGEAMEAGRLGLQMLEENAGRDRAAAVALDLAAQRLLTVEPAGLRDPLRAAQYARQAVDQTAGQMPPYLVTLSFAEHAMGLEDEARQSAKRAIQAYEKVAAILRPLFEAPAYPDATPAYREFASQLDRLAEQIGR